MKEFATGKWFSIKTWLRISESLFSSRLVNTGLLDLLGFDFLLSSTNTCQEAVSHLILKSESRLKIYFYCHGANCSQLIKEHDSFHLHLCWQPASIEHVASGMTTCITKLLTNRAALTKLFEKKVTVNRPEWLNFCYSNFEELET